MKADEFATLKVLPSDHIALKIYAAEHGLRMYEVVNYLVRFLDLLNAQEANQALSQSSEK